MLIENNSVSFFFISVLAFASIAIGATQPLTTQAKTVGEVVTDPKDRKLVFGGCDSDPYQALRQYIQGGNIIPKQSGNTLSDGIDPALACRLSKFLEYANKNVCPTKIISGYRSVEHQRSICGSGRTGCAPPGSSCHQYGLAVDLSSDCGGRLRAMSKQFQLNFPYSGVHVQCIEHLGAGRNSCKGPCDGGLAIQTSPDNQQYGPPSARISEQIRNMFSPPPPLQQAPTQQPTTPAPPLGTQNTTPYSPGTCAPQFYCQNNNLYYRTSTCVDQVSQVCPDGCEAGSCKGTRQGVSDLLGSALSDIGKSATSTDKKATSSLSAFDQINLIANPNVGQKPTTTDPFVLTIDGNSQTRLQVPPPPGSLQQPGNTYALIPPGQQTFISGDLMESPYVNPQQVTGFQSTLALMRAQLERIVAYLRPFGRPFPEGENAHFE